jgi:hypothetical protein
MSYWYFDLIRIQNRVSMWGAGLSVHTVWMQSGDRKALWWSYGSVASAWKALKKSQNTSLKDLLCCFATHSLLYSASFPWISFFVSRTTYLSRVSEPYANSHLLDVGRLCKQQIFRNFFGILYPETTQFRPGSSMIKTIQWRSHKILTYFCSRQDKRFLLLIECEISLVYFTQRLLALDHEA